MTDLSPVAFGRVGSNPARGTKHIVHSSNWLGHHPFTVKIYGFKSHMHYNVLSSNWLGNKILTLEIGVRSSTG